MQHLSTKDSASKQRKEIIAKYDNATKPKTDNWENPQYSIYATTDYYGFIHDEGLTDEFVEKENKIKKLDGKREKKWRKLLENKSGLKDKTMRMIGSENLFSNIITKMNDSSFREEITKRIYKGVPKQFKAGLWNIFLDVKSMKTSKPKVYQSMLKKALDKSPDVHQIDLDVNRTFRNTTYFRERYNDRQRALLHVLAAYSMYNTEIGYCQGMSEIAGLLLMYLVDEEDVFWGLSQLMTSSRYCMHGIFVAGFPRLLTFFAHLNNIINKLLPKIAKHFEKLDVMASSYALKWFMQCYLDRVPLTLFLRLWDIYLLEGEKLLIAMAYNILKMHKKRLIKMDHSSILQFFQTDLRKDFLYDDDFVIESLKTCIEELKKHKLSVPAPPQNNELPCRPFGTDFDFHTPSPKAVKERQMAQSNLEESVRRSMKKVRTTESQNPTKVVILGNSDEKERQIKPPSQEFKSRRNESSTKTNENDETIPSHIRYRIKHNSKLNKSRSLHSEEIKTDRSQETRGSIRKIKTEYNHETQDSIRKTALISPSENRSLTKSVPDLSNSVAKNSKKSTETNDNVSSTTNKFPSEILNNSISSDSNHLNNSRPTNSISKSKTAFTLSSNPQSSISRSIKRRPLSTSPETIL